MDTKTIGTILIKTTGLLLLVVSVSQLPGYFPLTGRGYDFSIGEALAAAALALGPIALLGFGLWFFPGTLVNKIVYSSPADPPSTDTRPIELVALSLLGVYLLADGLIGIVRDIVIVIVVNRRDQNMDLLPASVVAHMVATGVQLLIGGVLCLGAKGVARFIEKLRR